MSNLSHAEEEIIDSDEQKTISSDNSKLILTKKGKIFFATLNILVDIFIVIILEISANIRSNIVPEKPTLDLSQLVNSFIFFIQLFILIGLLPFKIYDIKENNYLNHIKSQNKYSIIISAFAALLLMLSMFYLGVVNSNYLIYFGIQPEILLAVIVVSFAMYLAPDYYITKYYKL